MDNGWNHCPKSLGSNHLVKNYSDNRNYWHKVRRGKKNGKKGCYRIQRPPGASERIAPQYAEREREFAASCDKPNLLGITSDWTILFATSD